MCPRTACAKFPDHAVGDDSEGLEAQSTCADSLRGDSRAISWRSDCLVGYSAQFGTLVAIVDLSAIVDLKSILLQLFSFQSLSWGNGVL